MHTVELNDELILKLDFIQEHTGNGGSVKDNLILAIDIATDLQTKILARKNKYARWYHYLATELNVTSKKDFHRLVNFISDDGLNFMEQEALKRFCDKP